MDSLLAGYQPSVPGCYFTCGRICLSRASDNLVLTFDEPVNVGFGTIKIYRPSDNSIFEGMSVTSATQVSGGGTTTITVNLNTMDPSTAYYVQIDACIL